MAYLQERNQIVGQVKKYHYIDGMPDIQVGLGAVVFGLYQLINALAQNPSSVVSQNLPPEVRLSLPIIFVIIWITVNYSLRKYMPKLRERVTYQRTGYVDFGIPANNYKQNNNVIIGIIIAGLVLILIFISLIFVILFHLFLDFKLVNSLMFLILATIFPIGYFLIWYKTDVQRYVFAGLLALLLGAGLYVYFLDTWNFANVNAPIGCYFIGIGVTELLLGLVTLRKYLREYPVINQVEE